MRAYDDFYFVCDHDKHRNAKRHNFRYNCCLGGETKATPKIVPFNKRQLTMKFRYTNKVESPIWEK